MGIITDIGINIGSTIIEWWKDLKDNIPVIPMENDTVEDMVKDTATCENVGLWFCYSGLPLLLTVVLLWVLYLVFIKNGKVAKHIKSLFIIAWGLSFLVYDVGMYTGQYISLFTNSPMAVVHACESFLLGSDVSAIHEPFHNNWLFMGLFSFSHAFSALVSMLFLLKYFGFNILQKINIYREGKRKGKKETFIFWGLNNPTYELIESINAHFANDHKLYRIIVVKTEDDKEVSFESKTAFSRIFEFLSMNDSELEKLQDMNCFICASNFGLNAVSRNVKDIIDGELRLKSLKKLLSATKSNGSIRLFFLSDNEIKNIHDVSVLLRDITLKSYAALDLDENMTGESTKRKVEFYCHARHNSVHRVIEDKNRGKNIEVHVIDSSHINVELLKTDETVLPINFVAVEADGTVSSAFNAMVIGFSEVGQDATRFLYEYSAFVKSGGNDDKAVRSDFHLEVIDKIMDQKAGVFIANAPAVKPYMPFVSETENKGSLLELRNIDACSVEFYTQLELKIKSLNYIVLATESDELNITLGVRILKMAIRYRENLKNLCILVRIHDDEDGHYARTAQYYNKLLGAQEATGGTTGTSNRSFLKSEDEDLPLYIFGQDQKIYTYANIIDNQFVRNAKLYKELYESSVTPGYVSNYEEGKTAWDKEIHRLLQLDEIFHCNYAGVMRLRRVQSQDISNSQHSLTKKTIAQKALSKCGKRQFDWESIDRNLYTTSYYSLSGRAVDEQIHRLLTVLAQTEHLRWNASHEILGYVVNEDGIKVKDESLQTHGCLTDWEHLDKETRSYDYNVVDVTFGIKNPNKNK